MLAQLLLAANNSVQSIECPLVSWLSEMKDRDTHSGGGGTTNICDHDENKRKEVEEEDVDDRRLV